MKNRIKSFLNRKIFYILNNNKFRYLSKTAIIQPLLRLNGRENISIGERVVIQKLSWIAAIPLTNAEKCHLSIGDGSIIGHFNHIFATGEIIIGKNVLTADKVYITDNLHNYENIELPIMFQGMKQLSKLTIGDGAWIGENVCIIGANIGVNSVVGANSVVTKDVPDYCVVVGSPAKIIKKYNVNKKLWERV